MLMSYLAICLPCRIKKRPIDYRSPNKRMVGRKLEMSTRSGSNYLTLAGKSGFLVSDCSGGFETRLYVHSSFAINLDGKERELVALLSLSSWCLLMVLWLFLAVPWVCLRVVIVVFSDHSHLLFLAKLGA